MHRNLHREIRIERLERCRVVRMIDRIKPHPLLPRRFLQHRRVLRGIDRSEPWRERTHAVLAVHLQIENPYRQRISRFRAFDEKRPCQRIVPLRHVERIARLLQPVAETVERVRVENVPRFQMQHRLRRCKEIFHVRIRGRVMHDVLRRHTANRKDDQSKS